MAYTDRQVYAPGYFLKANSDAAGKNRKLNHHNDPTITNRTNLDSSAGDETNTNMSTQASGYIDEYKSSSFTDDPKINEDECFIATIKGDDERLARYLDDVNTTDKRDSANRTPLHWAAWRSNTASINMYMQCTFDLNAKDSMWLTPVHYACVRGEQDVLRLLAQYGGKLHNSSRMGQTPLHIAAANGRLECVKYLLKTDKRIPINGKDRMGRTALDLATNSGHAEVVRALLARDAVANSTDKKGRCAAHWAIKNKPQNVQLVESLIYTCPQSASVQDHLGWSPLHLACANGASPDAVECLIDADPSMLEARDKFGLAPIHRAVAGSNDFEGMLIASELMQSAESFDLPISGGKLLSPLHCAASAGNSECVRLILTHHMTISSSRDEAMQAVHARDVHGFSAADYAAGYGHLDALEQILTFSDLLNDNVEFDSDTTKTEESTVYRKDKTSTHRYSITPFLAACMGGQEACVDTILKLKPEARNDVTDNIYRLRGIHLAVLNRAEHVVKLLSPFVPEESEYRHASEAFAKDAAGRTTMFLAASVGDTNMCELLLDRGVKAGTANDMGHTPLHMAALAAGLAGRPKNAPVGRFGYGSGRRSDETCLRTLLRNLTSQERKELQDKSDVYGSSFIHWVSRWGCPETVGSVLSVRKGDAKLRDKQGITPLHVAALGGHTLCVQQLIDNGADVRALTYQTHHTPLHYACIGGSVEAVSMLLSNGAESTSVCLPYKRTCLHIACIQGHTEVVVRLIQENATELELNYITVESTDTMDSIENSSTTGSANYIDCIDKFGLTPLALAMAKGHSQTAFKLLSLGADINCGIAGVVHDEGFEPLQHSQEAVNGITLWHCASAMSDISVLQNITQQSEEYDGSEAAGEWVTKCDGQLRAPLHYAVVYEREETVEKLLSLGAEIASLDTYGMSALHYAVQKGNMDILRLLTESLLGDSESDGESDDDSDDEDVQEENDEEANKAAELKLVLLEGIPLTHVACAYCDRAGQQYEAINLLLEGGIANLADTDKYKRTAAHVAAFKGKLGFLEKLYDGEADILQMKDYTGRTALDVAILKGHTHVIDWIKLQTETDPR